MFEYYLFRVFVKRNLRGCLCYKVFISWRCIIGMCEEYLRIVISFRGGGKLIKGGFLEEVNLKLFFFC